MIILLPLVSLSPARRHVVPLRPTKQRIRRTPPNSRLHHRLCPCVYTLPCIVIGHFLRPFARPVRQTHPNSSLCGFICRILLNSFSFYWHRSVHVAMAQIKDEKMDMSMNGPNNGNHKPKEEFHGGGRGGRGNRFQPYSGPNRDRKGPRDNNMVILLRFLSFIPSGVLLAGLTIDMHY